MKKIGIGLMLLALALPAPAARAADTVTSGTLTRATTDVFGGMLIETLDWVSDSSGNVTATLLNVRGTIVRITTVPDSGDTQPSDNYDVTLTDDDGVDVLVGGGANLSQTTAKTWFPYCASADAGSSVPLATFGDLDLAVTNAGAANGGRLRLFLKPSY